MSTLLLERPPLAGDTILLHAFARRGRPLSLGELLTAMTGTGSRLSDVMDLLADGLATGALGDRGFRADAHGRPVGPRLYELTDLGRDVLASDRAA